MFRGLRLRLTLLYLVVAVALLTLIAGGAYQVVRSYFQTTTDLALQHKMAHEFQLLGAPLPKDLSNTDWDWSSLRNGLFWGNTAPSYRATPEQPDGIKNVQDNPHTSDKQAFNPTYDSELATIFVLPLSHDGNLLFDPNPYVPPINPDKAAVVTALTQGNDWRTIQTTDGNPVRLFTYRLTRSDGPAVLQLGRVLRDQERVLGQLLVGLLALGGLSVVLLGVGSWWIAGRSLLPARQAWERQQAFIANAGHELRAPLTLMRAGTEVAKRSLSPTDYDQHELLSDVLVECDHMTRLVDDLLLLSRLDTGCLQLDWQQIHLKGLLVDIQRQMGRLIDERHIHLRVTVQDEVVRGDITRLRQVFLILLDNALRHTPGGGTIHITVKTHGRTVSMQVSDTGGGIAPEHQPHLFDRFYRVNSVRSDNANGVGLGLSIAKALIEAQHGQIMLTSALGQGTQITLSLPTA